MSILSDFEDRVAGAVEGLFAGAFRSPVQPAEIAKALSRAMDDRRQVGVSAVWAPTVFSVQISTGDAGELGEFLPTLSGELATYLVGHAGERGYRLAARPTIEFSVHEGLKLGRFRVAALMGAADQAAASREPEPDEPDEPAAAPLDREVAKDERPAGVLGLATVTVGELLHDMALEGDRVEIGRLAECGITLADANVSRRHAAFVREGAGWAIEDLDSTNGVLLNGERVNRTRLRDGDVIEIGATRLHYHEPRR